MLWGTWQDPPPPSLLDEVRWLNEVSLSVADGKGWNIVFDREPAKVSQENMTNLHTESPDFSHFIHYQIVYTTLTTDMCF